MQGPFEVKEVDQAFYRQHLVSFLPDRLIDIHTHVWEHAYGAEKASEVKRVVTWPHLVASKNPYEDLERTYQLMFPGKEVVPLIFGMLLKRDDDFDQGNRYVSECSRKFRIPALIFARPEWSADELEEKIRAGGFVGIKVYLSLAEPSIPVDQIEIFDFLPHHQLEVLDRNGWIVMLHIPRSGRLKDPVNLAQLMEIERKYPELQLIIAHVGRAYCPEDVGEAFEVLRTSRKMFFDFSANTNQAVFEELIRTVGSGRILFGSDLPVVRMRMRRICEEGRYVNLVPKGLYGDVSNDDHMREVEGEEAESMTFFLYEEIAAFQRACQASRLVDKDIEKIFHGNASLILREANGSASAL